MPNLKRGFGLLQMLVIIAVVAILCAMAIPRVKAQAPPDPIGAVLAEAPTVSLANETLSVSVGAVVIGEGSLESVLNGRYIIHNNFAVVGEIQKGTASQVIDSAGIYGQIRKAWDAYEIYGQLGGRRNWRLSDWEAVGGVGVSYMPAASTPSLGFLSKTTIVAEQRIVARGLRSVPTTETITALRWSF